MTLTASGARSSVGGDDLQLSGPVSATGGGLANGQTPGGWAVTFAWASGADRIARRYVICARP
jgi:hypothetical protein